MDDLVIICLAGVHTHSHTRIRTHTLGETWKHLRAHTHLATWKQIDRETPSGPCELMEIEDMRIQGRQLDMK